MNILVTGTTGFIGRALIKELLNQKFGVIAAVRYLKPCLPKDVLQVNISDLFVLENAQVMQDVEVVIHCAARVHIMNESDTDPLEAFRKVNTAGTLCLAKQAVDAGVKRFVFISSISVIGSISEKPFSESDATNPERAYAISKYEAELGLLSLAKETDLEVVIIRPPLVYGPNASGNFGSLVRWVNNGIPLPLGSVYNRRSFVALDNLVSFILLCADCKKSPQAANEIFLISDGKDVSTTDLIRKVGKAFGKKQRLIPVSVVLMKYVARLMDKGDVAHSLFGSLQIDSSKARELLKWQPVISMDEQLRKTADEYFESRYPSPKVNAPEK